jgi:riboflavin synthase
MFTGIIEFLGDVVELREEKENLHITMQTPLAKELKIDQSVAHNGVCLTVVDISDEQYTVTAIKETLEKSNLGALSKGDLVNLERCMKMGGRLDGHIVQGHVDATAELQTINEEGGSWYFRFSYPNKFSHLMVPKGSVTINGVSLTVVDAEKDWFSVAIIPYTYEHTNFHRLKVGDKVNIEFDVIGKYVERMMSSRMS